MTRREVARVPTGPEALLQAARCLTWAMDETDLARMERLQELGEAWTALAAIITGAAEAEIDL